MNTHAHHPRMDFASQFPEFHRAMVTLDAVASKDVDPKIAELVRIRSSQINHCAFCINMHVRGARAQGETEERVYLLNAWEEAGDLYTERERAALALTEAVTVLTDGYVPDEVYDHAAKHFDERELARVLAMIVTINGFNRLAVTTRKVPDLG